MKTIRSLFLSIFYPFIPAEWRKYADHAMAGGMIFFGTIVFLVVYFSK
jgi:hypothetical protein